MSGRVRERASRRLRTLLKIKASRASPAMPATRPACEPVSRMFMRRATKGNTSPTSAGGRLVVLRRDLRPALQKILEGMERQVLADRKRACLESRSALRLFEREHL